MNFNKQGYSMLAWEYPDNAVKVCAECLSPNAREVTSGDEGITMCPDCRGIECGYKHLHRDEVENE